MMVEAFLAGFVVYVCMSKSIRHFLLPSCPTMLHCSCEPSLIFPSPGRPLLFHFFDLHLRPKKFIFVLTDRFSHTTSRAAWSRESSHDASRSTGRDPVQRSNNVTFIAEVVSTDGHAVNPVAQLSRQAKKRILLLIPEGAIL